MPSQRDRPRSGASVLGVALLWGGVLGGGCAPRAATPDDGTATAAPRAVCAQIFSTNDTHGRLLAAEQTWSNGRLVGGSAVLAAYVEEARRETPACPVFVVSGGDAMQGTLISNLTDGASTIAAMNAIGYDAMAIGNHEFDWGVDVLIERVAEANFAMLGANIYLKGTDRHPDWVAPWTIVEKDGVRVGFVGMTTRSTPTTTRPANVVDFEFRSISEALDRYIPEVRAAGADFVVAVMHEGAFCDDAGTCEGEAIDALEATTAVFDYAVLGHTHSRVETEIRGVPLVESFSYTTAFGLGRMDRSADGDVSARLIGIREAYEDAVTPSVEVAELVETFRERQEGLVDRVVMRLEDPLGKPRRGDFPLGRLIADAQRTRLGTQVSLMNNGGIRRPLPAGEIPFGLLFELQPFGNRLYRLELSGRDLIAALEHALDDVGTDAQVSGLTIRYDPEGPAGERIHDVRLSDGTEVRPDGRYTATVNDFMATGGGGYTMFLDAYETEDTGIVDLDALVDYIGGLPQPVTPPLEPRWIPESGPAGR